MDVSRFICGNAVNGSKVRNMQGSGDIPGTARPSAFTMQQICHENGCAEVLRMLCVEYKHEN